MITLFKNIKECYAHIPYTFRHYIAFLKTEKRLTGFAVTFFHDWDKLLMFIFLPFLGERIINQWHQKHNSHHPTYSVGKDWKRILKTEDKINWVEAIIDWECARLTKPDKPLDAYDTLMKYVAQPYFEALGLWRG